jgi:hypothetical protein
MNRVMVQHVIVGATPPEEARNYRELSSLTSQFTRRLDDRRATALRGIRVSKEVSPTPGEGRDDPGMNVRAAAGVTFTVMPAMWRS